MSDIEELDYEAQALGRVISQYAKSTNLQTYIRLLVSGYGSIEKAALAVLDALSIDGAQGDLLDKLGERVGQGRELVNYEQYQFFGFDGGASQPNIGGFEETRFRDNDEPLTGNTSLADPEFRKFVRAKIIRNHSNGGPEDIMRAIELLFETPKVDISESGAKVSYHIGRPVEVNDTFLALKPELLPTAAGVRVTQVTGGSDTPFGFDGVGLNTGLDESQFIEVISEE